jgi:hypothetical protein
VRVACPPACPPEARPAPPARSFATSAAFRGGVADASAIRPGRTLDCPPCSASVILTKRSNNLRMRRRRRNRGAPWRSIGTWLRTTFRHSGCRSPRTASSRRRRGCSWRPRTCTTPPPTGGRSSTAPRALVLQRRPRAPEDHRGRAAPGGRARLCPGLPDGASQGLRTGEPRARPRARRVRARVLRELGVRGGGYRAQDRARLSPGAGRGEPDALIGRERGYHGVGFGGISVGGIVNNRKFYGTLLAGVDHLPHTHIPENRWTRRASPSMARPSPTNSSGSWRCTGPRRSPR